MKKRLISVLFLLVPLSVKAVSIVQVFDSKWTVAPYSYEGQVSAWQWQYSPYQVWSSSWGTLEKVTVSVNLTGNRDIASDELQIRASFFTGWQPADYQFFHSHFIGGGTNAISYSNGWEFTGLALLDWLTYDHLPQANHYFESRTWLGAHSIDAETTLTFHYTPVPERGSSIALMLPLIGMLFLRRCFIGQSCVTE